MYDSSFTPVLRFMVCSDVHYKDEHTVVRDRMRHAIEKSYELSEKDSYKKLDALYVVGDFANSGSPEQMKAFKKTLDDYLKPETYANVSLASHEFGYDTPEGAKQRLREIFSLEPNTHKVINGFHFISVGCSKKCDFDEPEKEFAANALKEAVKDSHTKPIFFFQHPHISDTVYGSINWGEDDLNAILCNYPQIIDFSGHSHAPINDPRSIHQRHFTCLGTGTLFFFENDEFDKYYGTIPPRNDIAAQMLIVEADAQGRVRIYPYDLITDNFFPFVWKIDEPWNPDSFLYTDERYKTDIAPYFTDDEKLDVTDIKEDGFTVTFDQAKIDKEYVNDYNVYVMREEDNTVAAQKNLWSEYYFYNMPERLSVSFDGLEKGEYRVKIYAGSFWKTRSKNPLVSGKIIL